jgi:hypothetical protein
MANLEPAILAERLQDGLADLDFRNLKSKGKKLIKDEEVEDWPTFSKYLFSCYLFGPTSFHAILYNDKTIKECVPDISHPIFCRYVYSIKDQLHEIYEQHADELEGEEEDFRFWPNDLELEQMEQSQKNHWRSTRRRR